MKLIKPDMSHKNIVLEYIKEFLLSDEEMHGIARSLKTENYEDWLIKANDRSLGYNLPLNKVRATIYLGIENNVVVGDLVFRHELNDKILNFNGHIGYTVKPSERNKGHATKMLKEIIAIAKEQNYKKLLVTCDVGNLASEKVILKNGGVFEDIRIEIEENNAIKRFWIDLSND